MKVETPNGDLVDKVTILAIKLERIGDERKRANIRREFDLLGEQMRSLGITDQGSDYRDLLAVNTKLWNIENGIREREAAGSFGKEFIELARSVYFENDARSRIKRRINDATGSSLVEEKEYSDYS